MERRVILAGAALVLGVLTIGYALFSPADDREQIALVLADLSDATSFDAPIANPVFHGSQLSSRFEEIFEDPVELKVEEVRAKIPERRGQLGLSAAQIMSRYGFFHANFSELDIQLDGEHAVVECIVSVDVQDAGQLRSDERAVSLDFSKESGSWLIEELRVQRPER